MSHKGGPDSGDGHRHPAVPTAVEVEFSLLPEDVVSAPMLPLAGRASALAETARSDMACGEVAQAEAASSETVEVRAARMLMISRSEEPSCTGSDGSHGTGASAAASGGSILKPLSNV